MEKPRGVEIQMRSWRGLNNGDHSEGKDGHRPGALTIDRGKGKLDTHGPCTNFGQEKGQHIFNRRCW